MTTVGSGMEAWPAIAVSGLDRMFGASDGPGLMGFVTLDHPTWIPVADARHVRDDDMVIGFRFGEHAYCVPFFIVDYYHTINTELAGQPVVIVSCDRCASSGAWHARAPDGRALNFKNWGILEAQLFWRDDETHTVWVHSTAVGVVGELAGAALDPLAAVVHMTFCQWRARRPDTLVLDEVRSDPGHRDMRHGHGRDEVFERPGIGAQEREYFLDTVSRPWDTRLPENEMVLGVEEPLHPKTYPWRAVKHEGNVVNDVIGDVPVVVWCDPAPTSAACAAFDRRVDARTLEFIARDGSFEDTATGSRWDLEGWCVAGELAGRQLSPVRSVFKRWFSWSAIHTGLAIFQSLHHGPRESRWGFDAGDLGPIVEALKARGFRAEIEEQVVAPGLPQGCRHGLLVRIDSDPFWLWQTATAAHARDLAMLVREHRTRPRALSRGCFVLEDACLERWTDWTHSVVRPDADIPWSALLGSNALSDAFIAGCSVTEPEPSVPEGSLSDVIDHLARHGQPVDPTATRMLPPSAREPGCEAAAELSIGRDRMILARHESASAAAARADRVGHCVVSDCFVLRSTPLNMYRLRTLEIAMRSEQRIEWAPQMTDEVFAAGFATAVRAACGDR